MIFSERMKLTQEYGKWIDERSRELGFPICQGSLSLLAFLDTKGMLGKTCNDAISRSHFEERVRLAGGMAAGEMTKDFEQGVLTVLEMLKTEKPVILKNEETNKNDSTLEKMMSQKGAIEWLKTFEVKCCHGEDETVNAWKREAIDIATRDIQRQIPKAVFYQGDGYADGHIVYDMAQCPECETWFEESDTNWETSYCPKCGQALDWNVEVEEDECQTESQAL